VCLGDAAGGPVRIPGTRVDEHMIVERKPVTDKVRLHQVVTQLQDTDDTSGAPGK
jgi:hypothetical protein